jgi:hypothetical protein
LRSVFFDKSSLVVRRILSKPKNKWVVRDFNDLVSLGTAQNVLDLMEKKAYVERTKKGFKSFTKLTNKEKLIKDWLLFYDFNFNKILSYYYVDDKILNKLKNIFRNKPYALSSHLAANFRTSFVKTGDIYVYVESKFFQDNKIKIIQELNLKKLVRGGNFHFIIPYYKNSVFYNIQKIEGLNTVSNLQTYLDLYNFKPRGKEHADYFSKTLKEKGVNFYES